MSHFFRFRVPYSEVDQMGVVRNSIYLDWLSTARIEALRDEGFSYKKLEDDGILLPVISTEIQFLSPARFDDHISIETRLIGLKKLKLEFDFKLFKEEGTRNVSIATANVVLGSLNKEFKPVALPKEIFEKLKNKIERI